MRACKVHSFADEEDSLCSNSDSSDSDYDYESDLKYCSRGKTLVKSNYSQTIDYTFILDIQKKDRDYVGKS